jgi:hypothetical protein
LAFQFAKNAHAGFPDHVAQFHQRGVADHAAYVEYLAVHRKKRFGIEIVPYFADMLV